jgi:hypothetical protein
VTQGALLFLNQTVEGIKPIRIVGLYGVDEGGERQVTRVRSGFDPGDRRPQSLNADLGAGQLRPVSEGAATGLPGGQAFLEKAIEGGHERRVGPRPIQPKGHVSHTDRVLATPQAFHHQRFEAAQGEGAIHRVCEDSRSPSRGSDGLETRPGAMFYCALPNLNRLAPLMDYQSAYNLIVPIVERKYGVEVMISDVVDPNTGDFDGKTILIDYDQDLEVALFVLVHLFGHTVQWNISDEYRALGLNVAVGKTPEEMAAITEYEQGATRMGITLLHEAGVRDMDGWASDWWRADFEYLLHFYATGEKKDVRSLLKRGGEALSPLPIPRFTPQKFASRWSF